MMNYKIKINDTTYHVEIEDINARPVIASVDGIRFEVMPENGEPVETQKEPLGITPQPPTPATSKSAAPSSANFSSGTLTSPLPGTVTEVFVKAGDQVEAGQVLLIVEAMKMKNSIRSTHGGLVKDVLVSAGQSVAHKQALVQFAE